MQNFKKAISKSETEILKGEWNTQSVSSGARKKGAFHWITIMKNEFVKLNCIAIALIGGKMGIGFSERMWV